MPTKLSTQRKATKSACSLHRGEIFDSVLDLKCFGIYKLSQVIFERSEAAFADSPLRIRHYLVLHVLQTQGPQSQQQLCEGLWIDRATMTAIIRDLVREHSVQKKVSKGDKRSFTIAITAEGRSCHKSLGRRVAQLEAELTAELPAKDSNFLQQILALLLRKFSA